MTPKQKRVAWVAGLAAAGAAIVGGVAYAVARAKGTTQVQTPAPVTTTQAPTAGATLSPAPTFPTLHYVPPNTIAPTPSPTTPVPIHGSL